MKSSRHISALLIILIFFISKLHSQNDLHFHHLNIFSGLPNNSARFVFQDTKGYLWLGTGEGLIKYDGVNKTVYHHIPGDLRTLSSSDVTCIAEDSTGNIWIGTSDGLNEINHQNDSLLRFPSSAFNEIFRSQNITSLGCDNDGRIWVGTSAGLFKYSVGKSRFDYILHKGVNNFPGLTAAVSYNGIQFDKNGNMYTALAGNIYKSSDKGMHFQELNLYHTTSLSKGELWISCLNIIDNNLWYADWGYTHVYCRDLTTEKQNEYIQNNIGFCKPAEVIYSICKTADNEIWFAGIQGVGHTVNDLFILNTHTGSIQTVKQNSKEFYSLHCGDVFGISKDKQGTIWLAGVNGIDYYNPEFSLYKTYSYKHNVIHSYQGGYVSSVCEDKFHNIWVGSLTNGLSCFNDSTNQFTRYTVPFSNSLNNNLNRINQVFADKEGVLWISTHSGIIQFDIRTRKFILTKKNSINLVYVSDDKPVICFAEDQQSNIWMGLWTSGILKYERKSSKVFGYSMSAKDSSFFIPREWPASMTVDDNNNLWIGYNDYGGFAKMNLNTRKFNYYSSGANQSRLNDPIINKILPLGNHTYLLATNKNGLKIFFQDQKNNAVTELRNDLLSNNINDIEAADDRSIWINTPAGLSRLNMQTNSVQNYLLTETQSQLNPGASCISSNKIFLGSDSTFLCFTIPHKKITDQSTTLINSFKINGKNFFINDRGKNFQLKYWQNNFAFGFTSINFIDPQSDRFSYMLQGYDKNWIDAGNDRSINYTNIPGGKYTFLVRSQNHDDSWSNPASLQIFIQTVFYKTWWFMLSCVFVLIALFYVFYTYRIKQLKKIYSLRTTIARDLHDEIGSTLSSISLRSEMAKKKLKQQNSELKEIDSIETDARNLIQLMSDIVWTINPLHDDIEQLMERMKNFAAELLNQKNILLVFNYDKKISQKEISLSARKNIYLIFKEAINNIVKYSNAKNVFADFSFYNDTFKMLIKDDGQGFDTKIEKDGNGLENMKSRAEEINGLLTIESQIGEGTAIELKLN